ncbi:MAG: ABC transporter permease [Actinomycetes bacterium]|jgi:peptide/nickel transport system permease protein|nr:ABC transporter permease [Actinomycetes bacterium]
MRSYTLNKVVQYVIVLVATSVIIFTMVRLGPTDPVAVIVGGKQTSPETIAAIRHDFKLDRSPVEQYWIWITGMLHGDFGTSFEYRQPVGFLIKERLPVTAGIVIMSTLISVVIAIPTGVIMAVKQHSLLDTGISLVELILVSSPPFLTSILMIWMITVYAPTFSFTGTSQTFWEFVQRIFLPSLALAFSMIALNANVMKSGMVEQLHSQFYRVAKAKGLTRTKIVIRHCLRNALIPVITLLGIEIGTLLVGSVLVENVFSLAGLGSILINAVQKSDYAMVQGVTMLLVFVFMTISTALDLVYGLIDPRIRLKRGTVA